jgi:PKD repeat protein
LARSIIHLILVAILTGILIGCNSTTTPLNPPNQNDNDQQGNQLPNPPPAPGQTVPGDNDPVRVNVFKSVDSGKVPLNVTFTSDVTGGVTPYKYFWDFDSNGVTDAVDMNPKALYASPGIYHATLTIEDMSGQRGVKTLEIEALNPTPNAVLEAIPSTGKAPLDVTFVAENSTPQAGAAIVKYQWDFDDDGIWDDPSTYNSENEVFTYTQPGNYYPVLRIYDNLGYWEEVSIQIIVKF